MRQQYDALDRADSTGVAWACIRFYPKTRPAGDNRPTGPTIHENTGHSLMGVTGVSIDPNNGWLRIEVDMPTGGAIGWIGFTPDEQLSMKGVAFGPSGGNSLTLAQVSIGDPSEPYGRKALDLRAPAHYAKIAGEHANVWVKLEHDLSQVQG